MLRRQQLTDLLTTRLLAAEACSPTTFQRTVDGLSPEVLCRAIKRLRSDSDADVALATLASDDGAAELAQSMFSGKEAARLLGWAHQNPSRAKSAS
jgi:hypothetical protein